MCLVLDFYKPTQRLTVDQTHELLTWLSQTHADVSRGRFGFCISAHTPVLLASGKYIPASALLAQAKFGLALPQLVGESGLVNVTAISGGVRSELWTFKTAASSFTVTPEHRCTLRWARSSSVHLQEAAIEVRWYARATLAEESTHLKPPSLLDSLPQKLLELGRQWLESNVPRDERLEEGDLVDVEARVLAKRWDQLTQASGPTGQPLATAYRVLYEPESPHAKAKSQAEPLLSRTRMLAPTPIVSLEVDGTHRFVIAGGLLTHNSQYLSIHAPPSIRALPHGVLVELVQLLLNQKVSACGSGQCTASLTERDW